MKTIFWHSQLFYLLYLCDFYNVKPTVLDCGAGGPRPPLQIFYEYGYKTLGVDISIESLAMATDFQIKSGSNLNILKGDMRSLQFGDESFGCVYSYNTIYHMLKTDVKKSILEMKRVLSKDGLMYFNVLSIDSDGINHGKDLGINQRSTNDNGESSIHSYYEKDELDSFLEECNLILIRKIIRSQEPTPTRNFRAAYIDYVLQKK